MSRVFLMGPLAWKPLLKTVLGEAPATTSIDLGDVELTGPNGSNAAFPFPHVKEGATSDGVAIELDRPEQFDALSHFASALGAHPVPKHALASGNRVSGIFFVADGVGDGGTYDQETWIEDWGDLALIAAREIMEYHGRLPAHDLHWRMPMILARAGAELAAQQDKPPNIRSHNTRDAVKLHEKEATHEGFFLTRTYSLQHPRFDGGMSDRLRREVFVASDAVIVLPYDPVRDRVLLVEQFRMGPFARGDTYPWVLEPVAGRVDAGETTQTAARRECEEEAGIALRHLEHVSSHYFSPGASTEYYHCFVGLADLPDEAAGIGGLDTEHEDIRTHILSFDAAMDLLTTGEANIGPMILLLLWLQRERPRLRALA